MPKYLNNVDLSKYQLLNARIQNLAAAPAAPVAGQFYYDTALNHLYVYNGAGWEQASGASGSGSVTSVAMTVPSWLTVAGSPITTAGTLAVTATAAQTANTFVATPSGAAGGVALRAIVAADVPKTLDHTWVTDFDTQVRTSRLDQMAAPTVAVSLGSQRLTNVADPTGPQDVATKNYTDAAIQGLQIKPTARLATTAALPANTYANGTAGVGATLTATANAALTVDGIAVAVGDLVLVKDEVAGARNGLYTVTATGGGAAAYVLTRHPDMDQAGDFPGAFIPVGSAGTTNANSLWLANPVGAVTVGTTAIPFTELNKAADLVAGTGITISGNTVSVATTYAGGASIATVGTVTAGTWQGTAVAVGFGGTGATTAAGARTNLGTVGKYQATIGDGTATSYTIAQATHGLAADSSIHVQVLDDTSGAVVFPDVSIAKTTGTVTLTFATAPTANQYRVVLIG